MKGGFLRDLDFLDRGGTSVIFHTGAIAGIMGALVLGPRYGMSSKQAKDTVGAGGSGSGG